MVQGDANLFHGEDGANAKFYKSANSEISQVPLNPKGVSEGKDPDSNFASEGHYSC